MHAYRVTVTTTSGSALSIEYAPTRQAAVVSAADRWLDKGKHLTRIYPAEYLGTVEEYEAKLPAEMRGWKARAR